MTKRRENLLSVEISGGLNTLTTDKGAYVWLDTEQTPGTPYPVSGICVRFRNKCDAEKFLEQIQGKSPRMIFAVNSIPEKRQFPS